MIIFFSTYYGHVVQRGKEIFPDLKESTSKLILIKLGDLILLRHQNFEKSIVEDKCYNLSDRQLAGLQYLSGYIMQKLYKKASSSKTPENQMFLSI